MPDEKLHSIKRQEGCAYNNEHTMKQRILKKWMLWIGLVIIFNSCERPEWKEHYEDYDKRVDMGLWAAIKSEPQYSKFVDWMEEQNLDTLFDAGLSYTIFIPGNQAIESYDDTLGYALDDILLYHISPTIIQIGNINTLRKVQTLTGKFSSIENYLSGSTYDTHPITHSSPLFLDGKYFEISEIALPRPNLYEFTALYSSVIKEYIDRTDSVFLDKNLSIPIGFDPEGNTIWDSVFTVVNKFEREYFPVSTEFRDKSATFVLFTQNQYIDALDRMADDLGGGFTSADDIPEKWQFDVLLPNLMKKSLFDGSLDYTDFQEEMVSITGDTISMNPYNIDPASEFLCSNGKVFSFLNFDIPKELYVGGSEIQGEELIDSIGVARFAWNEDVTVSGLVAEPLKQYSGSASEGSYVVVSFPRKYTGKYSFQFEFEDLFPMKYRLVWAASYRPSGLFAIYVNDKKIGEYDNYNLRSTVVSVTGEYFTPVDGLNRKDWWVDNIVDFGNVTIRFEYLGPGAQSTNGFNIDYIALIPAEDE